MIEFENKFEKNSQVIDRFLDHNLPSGNGLNSKLFDAMRYSSICGGKNIRAYLVIETGRFLSAINNENLSSKLKSLGRLEGRVLRSQWIKFAVTKWCHLDIKKKELQISLKFDSYRYYWLNLIYLPLNTIVSCFWSYAD